MQACMGTAGGQTHRTSNRSAYVGSGSGRRGGRAACTVRNSIACFERGYSRARTQVLTSTTSRHARQPPPPPPPSRPPRTRASATAGRTLESASIAPHSSQVASTTASAKSTMWTPSVLPSQQSQERQRIFAHGSATAATTTAAAATATAATGETTSALGQQSYRRDVDRKRRCSCLSSRRARVHGLCAGCCCCCCCCCCCRWCCMCCC